MSWIVMAVATAVSGLVTWRLIPILRKRGRVDVPNERSSHSVPTPRGGGLGLLTGAAAGLTTAAATGLPLPSSAWLFGCALVALAGYADDRLGGLSAGVRLLVQAIAAWVVAMHSGGLDRAPIPGLESLFFGGAGIAWAVLWMLAVTNFYNFLDGIDGFAGLQGVLAGASIAVLVPDGGAGVAGMAIAGGCCGFLVHNWHPAKVFMGDVGSGTLGFAFAALPLEMDPTGRADGVFVVAISLWFFLADGTFTLVARALRRERIWLPHRSHLYQRLVRTGAAHDRVAMSVLGAAAVLTVLAIVSIREDSGSGRVGVFCTACVGFGVYYGWTRSRERSVATLRR